MDLPKRWLPAILAIWLGVGVIGLSQKTPEIGQISPKTAIPELSLTLIDGSFIKAIPVLPIQGQVLAVLVNRVDVENPIIDCLIFYESSGNPEAFNPNDPNGGSIGLLQFQKPTWDLFNKKYGLDLDIENPADQKFMAQKMLEENPKNIGHWSTAKFCKGQ